MRKTGHLAEKSIRLNRCQTGVKLIYYRDIYKEFA